MAHPTTIFWRRWRPLNKTPPYGSRSFFIRNDAFWPRDSGMTWHDLNVHLTLAWTNAWAVGATYQTLQEQKTKPFGKMRSQLDLPTDPNGDWRTTLLLWLAKHEMFIFISRRKVVWKSYWFFPFGTRNYRQSEDSLSQGSWTDKLRTMGTDFGSSSTWQVDQLVRDFELVMELHCPPVPPLWLSSWSTFARRHLAKGWKLLPVFGSCGQKL